MSGEWDYPDGDEIWPNFLAEWNLKKMVTEIEEMIEAVKVDHTYGGFVALERHAQAEIYALEHERRKERIQLQIREQMFEKMASRSNAQRDKVHEFKQRVEKKAYLLANLRGTLTPKTRERVIMANSSVRIPAPCIFRWRLKLKNRSYKK